MKLTLGAARPLLAGYAVTGVCADDPRVVTQINLARERLMKKPTRWKGMVQRYVFNLFGSCLTLPREIQTIEGAEISGTRYAIRNQWFEILEGGPGKLSGKSCMSILQDRGDNHAMMMDLPGLRQIAIYGDIAEASGAGVLIQGYDADGNRVQTYNVSTGGFDDGEFVKINPAVPGVANVSKTFFRAIDGIQKPTTKGFVRIYAVTGSDDSDETVMQQISFTGSEIAIASGIITLDQISWSGAGADFTWTINVRVSSATDTIEITAHDSAGVLMLTSTFAFTGVLDQLTVNVTGLTSADGVTGVAFTLGGFTSVQDPGADTSRAKLHFIREFTAGTAASRTAVSVLHPSDTAPCYRRYEVTGLKHPAQDPPPQIMVLAVLRYLPVTRDSDWLVIDNVGALQHMLQALRYERDGDPQKAIYHEGKAEFILKQELENFVGHSAIGGGSVQLGAFAPGEVQTIL